MKIAELKLNDPKQKEEQPIHYWAFGMNCDPRVMSVHEYCKPIGGAVLDGHKLSFAQFADILPAPGQKMGGARGQATDMLIQVNEIMAMKKSLTEIYVKHNSKGKTFDELANDMERDHFMSAQQALDYGLIDSIITKRG
jgi:hypothetical protein